MTLDTEHRKPERSTGNWTACVQRQLADEARPFGVAVTVNEGDDEAAVVRLYTESPLHETLLTLRPGCANVEERYEEAVRQHKRAVVNLGGMAPARLSGPSLFANATVDSYIVKGKP